MENDKEREGQLFYSLVAQHFTEKQIPLDLLVASILLPQKYFPRTFGQTVDEAGGKSAPPYTYNCKQPLKADEKVLPELHEMLEVVDKIMAIVRTVPKTKVTVNPGMKISVSPVGSPSNSPPGSPPAPGSPTASQRTGLAAVGSVVGRAALSEFNSQVGNSASGLDLLGQLAGIKGGQAGGATSSEINACLKTCEELKKQLTKLWASDTANKNTDNILMKILYTDINVDALIEMMYEDESPFEDCRYEFFKNFETIFTEQSQKDQLTKVTPPSKCSELSKFTLKNMWKCRPYNLETFRVLYVDDPDKKDRQDNLRECLFEQNKATRDPYLLFYKILAGKPPNFVQFDDLEVLQLFGTPIQPTDLPKLFKFMESGKPPPQSQPDKGVWAAHFNVLMTILEEINARDLYFKKMAQYTAPMDAIIKDFYRLADLQKINPRGLWYLVEVKGLDKAYAVWEGTADFAFVWKKIPILISNAEFDAQIAKWKAFLNLSVEEATVKVFELFKEVMTQSPKAVVNNLDRPYLEWNAVRALIEIYIVKVPDNWEFVVNLGKHYSAMYQEMVTPSKINRAFAAFTAKQRPPMTPQEYMSAFLRPYNK
jgi:hypothetical protein